MSHFSGRKDRSILRTPIKSIAPADATPNPPNTLERIYSNYRPEMPPGENIGDTSAKTFAELLSGPLLEISVGPDGRQWMLHQSLLIHHTRFFDESYTVNGEHKRIKDGKLELRDQDPSAFELLLKWLYQGKIDDVSWMPKDVKWDYAFTCQKLYLLCEAIGLQELKNLAIDQFRRGCHEAGLVPGPEEMKPIYEHTQPSSPFRKLVSRIAARQIMDPASEKDASSYKDCFVLSPDFAVDVINAIKESTGGSLFDDPTEGNSCRYHEHDDGETCHKTVKFKDMS
ncbi:hypothetical protein LTR99_003641 [Exophiala xenobiotica]|uniref:BTB domain-containing protein n=1 Tax=Vermiconidia calcicola TaxID=1690605 RepID=A0AAV9PZJ2_9PEZI|nr:hypothetical protein LTR99_003641 [Exophiala xenobiotica]KAK5435111.1 hypothetical protein LTR34_002612 [Exophiala xenobiotica]KAK5531336.1 hypothetical protein LTR25_008443 [Vermiconidia calcicola]KAK5540600.1 hypothetical protein LTR23_006061 [Chaetothyriales sp. CCFEE 6169]